MAVDTELLIRKCLAGLKGFAVTSFTNQQKLTGIDLIYMASCEPSKQRFGINAFSLNLCRYL
jgi:hypothetical protein